MDIPLLIGAAVVAWFILRASASTTPPVDGTAADPRSPWRAMPPADAPPVLHGGAGQGGGNVGYAGNPTGHTGYAPPPATNGSIYSAGPGVQTRGGGGHF